MYMQSITRRNIVGSAGLAVASAPFMFPKGSYAAFGQAAPPSGPKVPPASVFNDLSEYTQNGAGSIIVAAKNGSLSSSHLQRAASRTHMFARHLDSLNVDNAFSSLVASTSYSAYSSNVDNYQRQALASAQSFDPTLQLGDLPSYARTQDQFEAIRVQVSSLGLSGVQHLVADAYNAGKKQLDAGWFKPAVWDPTHHASSTHHAPLNDLVYRNHQAPHFLLASSACPTSTQKSSVCAQFNAVNDTLTVTGVVLTAIGLLCVAEIIGAGPLGAVLCGLGLASLGASITIHGLALTLFLRIYGC
jgi:hypothetical protein